MDIIYISVNTVHPENKDYCTPEAAIPLRGPAATPTGSVPVVLRSVLVPTPKLAPLTRRVNDEGLRARIVHAPETASDKARVLAEGGHAPRSPKYLQDDALRRPMIPAAHRPPVLARAKLSGKIRELIHERAYLAVVANHQRLNLPEPEQACLDGARRRARHRAAVPRVEPARFVDVLTVHSLRPTLHRPAPALVFEVGLRVGGNAPMQKLALDEPARPHASRVMSIL